MTHITRISYLRDYGVFHSFTWPSDLLEFGRYNLVYGWNGTGKTTLSRLFRNLECRQSPTMGKVTLCISGRNVTGEEFSQSNVQVRVFNRDFIQENVFPLGGEDMSPIYVVGAENVAKQKQVEKLKKERIDARSELERAESSKVHAERELDQFNIRCAKLIKETLLSSGRNPYKNYNKANFFASATEMLKFGNGTTHILTDDEHRKLRSQCDAKPKSEVKQLSCAMPNFELVMDRLSKLLRTSVVSETIEALKSDSKLAAWTREGLTLHRDRNTELCQFCEQPLPRHRLAALEAHFNDQYEKLVEDIDREIAKLVEISNSLTELELPREAELDDDYHDEFRTAKAKLTDVIKSARDFCDAAVKELKTKKHKVFESVQSRIEAPLVSADVIDNLNALVQKHNQLHTSNDFENRLEKVRKRLVNDMIAKELEEFSRLGNAEDSAKKTVEAAKNEVGRLDAKISKLEYEISEHHQPAEELNEELRNYLGHHQLRLEIKETGYAITRGTEQADSLSEGETTAIALLYFLKSLRDRRFTLANGVVVLDDPVSSLDANALFLAFGFIRECTENAGQLFILTHNFLFFRQVRNWFYHVKGQRKNAVDQRPARFFMIEPVLEGNVRNSTIRSLPSLLEKYDSEYHYLFVRVYNASIDDSELQGVEKNYVLPNIARRMLETFLAFRLPNISGSLWKKLEKVQFDKVKKLRIIRFLHTHSHSTAMGEPEHDLTALAEGTNVLKDLLEMIKSLDDVHYSAMVELVDSSANSRKTGNETKAI